MKELCAAICGLWTMHPDGALIVSGDFTHATLRLVLPKFFFFSFFLTRISPARLENIKLWTTLTPILITFLCFCSLSTPQSINVWNLCGIYQAEYHYKLKVEEHFNSSNIQHMWQEILTITDSKSSSTELNYFHDCFDQRNKGFIINSQPPSGKQPLSFSTSKVCSTLA